MPTPLAVIALTGHLAAHAGPADRHAPVLFPMDVPALDGPPGPSALSDHGFYSPTSETYEYDCSYSGSSGADPYTTLYADNYDGGTTARSVLGEEYEGSLCDEYDDYSGVPYNGQFCGCHPGVDIGEASGTEVYAITSGTIVGIHTGCDTACTSTLYDESECEFGACACGGGWGNHVVLEFDAMTASGRPVVAYATVAHLRSVATNPSTGVTWALHDEVEAGDQLGEVGSTGCSTGAHLHFQLDKAAARSHPYWPATDYSWSDPICSHVSVPDVARELREYTYNPLYAIGFGECF